MTASFNCPNILHCATTGTTQAMSFCNKQSDDVFHLSPFAQLHKNTIFPIYNINTIHACSNTMHSNSNSEGDYSSIDAPCDGPEDQSCEVSQFYPMKCAN